MNDANQTYPRGVPTLTSDEFQTFLRRVAEFDAPADVEEGIERHRRAMRDDE